MARRAVFALGLLILGVGACGGSEFVSGSSDAGASGGNAGSGGTGAGNGGTAGNSSGGSTVGGTGGSVGGSGGANFDCQALDCDDSNQCTTDSCDPSKGCIHEARDGQACDDGVFCNGADQCAGTQCKNTQGSSPCNGAATQCDETNDTCVGCLKDEDCPVQMFGAWSNCMFDSTCAQGGTKTREVTTYKCETGTCKGSVAPQSDTCTRTTDNITCDRDGNSCTDDVCSNGTCTHPPRVDGSICTNENTTGANYLCCGGHCKYTEDDDANCGGCFVKCTGNASKCNGGYCRECGAAETDCGMVSPGMVCNVNADPARCECVDDGDCPQSWQTCNSQHKCRGTAPAVTNP